MSWVPIAFLSGVFAGFWTGWLFRGVFTEASRMTDRDRRIREAVAEHLQAGGSTDLHIVVGHVLGRFRTGIEPGKRDYQGMQSVADEVQRVLQELQSQGRI